VAALQSGTTRGHVDIPGLRHRHAPDTEPGGLAEDADDGRLCDYLISNSRLRRKESAKVGATYMVERNVVDIFSIPQVASQDNGIRVIKCILQHFDHNCVTLGLGMHYSEQL
jgi:hypothetical protein